MYILIRTIENEEMKKRRGFTGADWWFDPIGNLHIMIAEEISDPKYQKALAIHEMTEALHCELLGITTKQVDDFDEAFEKLHPENHGLNAGDAPGCPYAVPHSLATAPERVYAACAGICWSEYDEEIGSL